MKKRTSFLLFICLCLSLTSWASKIVQQQNSSSFHTQQKKQISLITGFQTGVYSFAEIGIGFKNDMIAGHHPNTSVLGISNELKLNQDFVWGLKMSAWSGGGVGGTNIGLNLINYTDFQNNSIRFRPEFGLGFGYFRMIYGYNFAITNKDFEGINSHLFGINILLDIKRVDSFKLF
jgi:hypothetical protein